MKNCPSWRNCWSGVNPEASTWRPCTSCLFSVLPPVISLLQFCLCCLPLWLFSLLTLCVNVCVCASIHIRPHSEHQEAVRAFSRNAAIWWPTEGITTLSHFPEFDRAVWCVLCVFYDACTTRKQMMDQILARLWAVPLLPPPFWTQSFLCKDTTEAFFFSSFLAAVYLLHHFILSDFGAEQQKCVRVLCQLSPSRHSKLSNKSSGVPPRGLPVSLALISPSFFTQLWQQTASLVNRYFQSGADGALWVCLQMRLLCFCWFSELLSTDCYSRVHTRLILLPCIPTSSLLRVSYFVVMLQNTNSDWNMHNSSRTRKLLQADAGTLNRPQGL